MRRYTTPTHRFTLQVAPELISKIRITYSQDDKIILKKETEQIAIEGNVAIVKLTQEETALFVANKEVEIQIAVRTFGEDALRSDIIRESVERVLDNEVI